MILSYSRRVPACLFALLFMGLFGFVCPVMAQTAKAPEIKLRTTEDSVKAAVDQLFTAMKTSDPSLLRASFTDSAILQTVITDKEGKTLVRSEKVADFADAIGKLPKGAADERIRFDVVRIDGDLAMVWAPYTFYYNGNMSHCGVDSFQLVRVNGVWKILYIIDTRRKQPC